MKRFGHIIEEIIDEGNLNASFDYVMRGRMRKRSHAGRVMMKNRERVIRRLQQRIGDGSYRVAGYENHIINERGKQREIQSIPLTDRVALNAIMRVVEPYLNRRFICDSAASIKGRGTHYLLKRMVNDMKKDPEGSGFVYKCDIRKFYQSINQDAMMYVLRRTFKDKRLLEILDGCVRLLPEGLSIGLRTSQALGNLMLDYYLDHVLKDRMGVKHYRRYCDDEVIQAGSFRELTPIRKAVHDCLERAGLEVKGNEQMFCLDCRPVDFLGFQVFDDGRIRIRKHIKQRFARRWRRVKSNKRRVSLAGSFYGLAKHAHAKHLFKKITGVSMKNFADFGLQYTSRSGKKMFDCDSYRLGDLQNMEIIVLDYERNVKTKEGEDRYVVRFQFANEDKDGKFFTNSDELKQNLDQIAELDEGFPFSTVVKRTPCGNNKFKYIFT